MNVFNIIVEIQKNLYVVIGSQVWLTKFDQINNEIIPVYIVKREAEFSNHIIDWQRLSIKPQI